MMNPVSPLQPVNHTNSAKPMKSVNPMKMSLALLLKAACVLLVLLAFTWTALHLNWGAQGTAVTLAFSAASKRAGERMPIRLPQGNVAVNTATVDELCELRGVGPALAQAIIAEREANGAFVLPEDLLSVKGIGEKKLESFLEQIRMD